MVLECPKCKTRLMITDRTTEIRYTCSEETCKAIIHIKRLSRDDERKLSVYELAIDAAPK